MFEQIAGEHPQAATSHWDVVRRLAIESQRLDLLRTYGADLMQEFERDEAIQTRALEIVPHERLRSAVP